MIYKDIKGWDKGVKIRMISWKPEQYIFFNKEEMTWLNQDRAAIKAPCYFCIDPKWEKYKIKRKKSLLYTK